MDYYLIGIMGSGMRALATLLLKMGHNVNGADIKNSFYMKDKIDKNINVENLNFIHLNKKNIYIIGNSFRNHKIVKKIDKMGITHIDYPQFLDKLDFDLKIAVCGSHGKTTTVKMVESLAGISSLVGDGSANYQNQMEFVYEACEYRDTFLNYHPNISIFLNVDYDHTDYFKTKEAYANSFFKFSKQSQINIFNYDDEYLRKNIEGYGYSLTSDKAYLYAKTIKTNRGYLVEVLKPFKETIQTSFYGIHQVRSFLSVLVLYKVLNKNIYECIKRLTLFHMPDRRFNEVSVKNRHIILDYAHHPSQLEALYNKVNYKYPALKKYIIYEGHTLERSLYFIDSFKDSLNLFDEVYLFKLYLSNREKKSKDEAKYYHLMNYKRYNKAIFKELKLKDNYVLVLAGAGNIDKLYVDLKEKYFTKNI